MNDEGGDSNTNKKIKIECDDNSRADDDKNKKPDNKDYVKDDNDCPTSDESTWDYMETNIHKILTKDLWHNDLSERNIHDCIKKLKDLCLVKDDTAFYTPVKFS
jgi:hypothetical protein